MMEVLLNSWKLFALGSAIFAALTAVLGKIGIQGINSNFATFVRTIVILLMIGAIVSFRREWQSSEGLNLRHWLFLVASGLCTGLSWLCYFRALQLGPASKVAPLDKLSVVFAIILAALFLGESLSVKVFMGGLLIVAGSILIAFG